MVKQALRSSTTGSACARPRATAPRPRRGPAWKGSTCARPRDVLIPPLHSSGGGPADVALRAVGVRRDLGPVEHQRQLGLVGAQAGDGRAELGEARHPAEGAVEPGAQGGPPGVLPTEPPVLPSSAATCASSRTTSRSSPSAERASGSGGGGEDMPLADHAGAPRE